MKRSIGLWQLSGFSFTSLLGTVLHFLYEWSNEAVWVAPFSGVNESTWEHMKLLFWATFAFAVIQSFFFKDTKGFWCVKLRGIALGLILIPVIFYTYNGVVAKSPDWINIAIFYIAAGVAYAFEARLFYSDAMECRSSGAAFVTLCIIGITFGVFTFITPEIGIFRDPMTGGYGI
ncbi:MAG: hypothetical protein E7312_00550 [Clostridiales bacterium]|nr:hypothetical protein [Clostridiales bacterium]